MNYQLMDAQRATPILMEEGRGKFVLVRKGLIDYFTELCTSIDSLLAQIPQLLAKHQLQEYDTEPLQRAILRDGFAAVQGAVYNRTIKNLEKSGLFPKVQKELANKNVDCLPEELRGEIEDLCREIQELARELEEPLDFEALWFRSGKLRIPPKYLEGIAPRYTLPVSDKERKTVAQIRQAAELIEEIKKAGVELSGGSYLSPADGKLYPTPGLLERLTDGKKYTDAELLAVVKKIPSTL